MGPPPPPPPPPPPGMPPSIGNSQTALPKITPDRNALLGDIRKGAHLKKAVTNDRSAPKVGDSASSSSITPVAGSAPPIPGMSTPSAPSIPMGAPQLGDIFASGMPTLKHVNRPVKPGANAPSVPSNPLNSSTPSVPSGRPKRNSMNFSPNVPHIPAMAPPSAPAIPLGSPPALPKASTPLVPTQRPNLPSNTTASGKVRPKMPVKRPTKNSMPAIPTTGAPALPSSTPSLPNSAPPLPTSTPPLPTSAPPLPTSAPPPPLAPPTPPSFPTSAAPQAPPAPPAPPSSLTNQKFSTPAPPLAAGLPFLDEINKKRDNRFVVDDDTIKSAKSASQISSTPAVNIPVSSSTPPAIPTFNKQPLSSKSKIPFGAPPLPTAEVPKLPTVTTSSAPAIPKVAPPSFPATPAMAAPPAPPSFGNVPLPPGPPPPPSFTRTSKPSQSAVPAIGGGLPFLDEINKRRNDTFVVDDKAVAHKKAASTSAPPEQDTIKASTPSAPLTPSVHVPNGNPLMDEIMGRTQRKSSNSTSNIETSLSRPSIPISPPPPPIKSTPNHYNVPPGFGIPGISPSVPQVPPSIPPSIPSSVPPSAPPAPPISSTPPAPPLSSTPPAPPSMQHVNSSNNNIGSDSSSIFSASRLRKKSAPPPPPPPPPPPGVTDNEYSSSPPNLETITNSLNLTSAVPATSPSASHVEDTSLFGSIRSKFGSGFKHHHHKSTSIQNDTIIETQVAGNEIRRIDASAYTISGSVGGPGRSTSSTNSRFIKMESPRFKFNEQNELPSPHKFEGRIKLYPSGRGSSVPLDLSNLA